MNGLQTLQTYLDTLSVKDAVVNKYAIDSIDYVTYAWKLPSVFPDKCVNFTMAVDIKLPDKEINGIFSYIWISDKETNSINGKFKYLKKKYLPENLVKRISASATGRVPIDKDEFEVFVDALGLN